MKLFIIMGCLLLTACLMLGGSGDVKVEMLSACSDLLCPKAERLAKKLGNESEARQVRALCTFFDPKKQDLDFELPELSRICQNSSINKKLRLQAGLASARATQTLQMREGGYSIADDIDYNKIYDKIIQDFPFASEASLATVYRAQGYFEKKQKAEKFKNTKYHSASSQKSAFFIDL